MSQPNYTLDIISHHPQFKNKSLRKYYVEGIETIGAWGDEPFEIRFKNNTAQKLQVKLSLDGTDILTGKPADTEISKDMWVVNAYGVLNLKAWPETSNGGAQFVFTSAEKSVALHTHGDLSNRGIIAAAVFVEGHVEPIRLNPPVEHHHHHHYDYIRRSRGLDDYYKITCDTDSITKGVSDTRGTLGGSSSNFSYNSGGVSGSSLNAGASYSSNSISNNIKTLESLVSVGAGQHVDQKITYVTGLIKPVLTTTVRVKYVWWDDLVVSLKSAPPAEAHPSGFPGDKPIMSIGSTPRISKTTNNFISQYERLF